MSERVAIIGSRDWPEPDRVWEYVRGLPAGTIVVTGAWVKRPVSKTHERWFHVAPTRGVDFIAARAAEMYGLTLVLVAGSVTKHGRMAGKVRNPVIIDLADRVAAFWDGVSPGTPHGIRYAKETRKPVEVIRPGDEDG